MSISDYIIDRRPLVQPAVAADNRRWLAAGCRGRGNVGQASRRQIEENMDTPKCDKCDKLMIEGYVPDAGHSNMLRQLKWFEGQPEVGWFGLKVKGKTPVSVTAYRCPKCGKLEFYAWP